jgi:hypothetical protein
MHLFLNIGNGAENMFEESGFFDVVVQELLVVINTQHVLNIRAISSKFLEILQTGIEFVDTVLVTLRNRPFTLLALFAEELVMVVVLPLEVAS